jgi:hypothetical protein
LAGQSQEGLGFLEAPGLDFCGLEFFLLGIVGVSTCVIWSLNVT